MTHAGIDTTKKFIVWARKKGGDNPDRRGYSRPGGATEREPDVYGHAHACTSQLAPSVASMTAVPPPQINSRFSRCAPV